MHLSSDNKVRSAVWRIKFVAFCGNMLMPRFSFHVFNSINVTNNNYIIMGLNYNNQHVVILPSERKKVDIGWSFQSTIFLNKNLKLYRTKSEFIDPFSFTVDLFH